MNRFLKILVILFGFFVVYFGLAQLAFKNTIFANDPKRCCNAGGCLHATCSSTSTVQLFENNCIDITINCFECLDLFADLGGGMCLPLDQTDYCVENGVKYYGDGVWETRTITFNHSQPVSGAWYVVNSIKYYPITTENFIYKSTHSFSARSVFKSGINWYRFKEWNFGSVSNPANYYIGANATVYAIYEQFDPTKALNDYDDLEVSASTNILENYPNPFNPSTKIKYTILKPGHVRLNIYNSLGELVEELVNDYKRNGSYEVIFNASNLPSGVYYYYLITNGKPKTNKMFLIK